MQELDVNDVIAIRVDEGGTLLVDGQYINVDMEEINTSSLLEDNAEVYENADSWWSEKSTEILIRSYKKYQTCLNDPNIKNRSVWNNISTEVGINRLSCQKKWAALLKTYRHKFYNSKKTKTNRWKFFHLMDDIVGKSMDVNQVSLAGSSSGFAFNEKSPSLSEDETSPKPKTRRKAVNNFKMVYKSSSYLEEHSKLQKEETKINQKLFKYLSEILNDTWDHPTFSDNWQKEQSEILSNFLQEDLMLRREEIKATEDFLTVMTKLINENHEND